MTGDVTKSFLAKVDFHSKTNNLLHHTSELSTQDLVVRRGQAFTLTLTLTEAFNPQKHPLTFSALTGRYGTEEQGTAASFGIPEVKKSPSAKAVWKVALQEKSSAKTGILVLSITPPANAPIGEYILTAQYRKEDMLLAMPKVLFNAWCSDDSVYLKKQLERHEYVLNEKGTVYIGSKDFITSKSWDFGQFEDDMVRICLKLLDMNRNHLDDPATDRCNRSDPVYVGRVVSAMVNSQGDHGILQGRWGGPYRDGISPGHWTGSHAILKHWYDSKCSPVRYGQCWVFASVMCTVMRLLGIPCRVVTNFSSAHDTNSNLLIDTVTREDGSFVEDSDSVWNFHVWTEGWMKRPDLNEGDSYDGWQVLDPTPQETSQGIYCCGPAPVKAIHSGNVHLKYDVPFVFAEVNADCVDWLLKEDGTKVRLHSDSEHVGQNISTKFAGKNKRKNITNNYKHREGSDKEREVFKYARTIDFTTEEEDDEWEWELEEGEEGEVDEEEEGEAAPVVETPDAVVPLPEVSLRFEEVSRTVNGQDVSMKLVLHSESQVARQLSVRINVQAMLYNGTSAGQIQQLLVEETLLPGKDLTHAVLVPFSAYKTHMLGCDSMKVSAVVTDKEAPDKGYLATCDVVLKDPPMSITVSKDVRLFREAKGEVIFKNPVQETLTNCSMTLSGSGLLHDEASIKLPDLKPNCRYRIKFFFFPYRIGMKKVMLDLDCSLFRDIQASCKVTVSA